MPTFTFTDPQGRKHHVTGPPGATAEQAFQVLQSQSGGGGAPAPAGPDPTEGMSYGEKAIANLGAGLDTTWQGAKQLVGQGMSDEELREKRKRDKALAEATFGGGVIQTVGEILPTIPLGLGAGALAARGVLGAAGAAAAASPTISAALGGATAGALQPVTEDESRLTNTGLGAVTGGVAPSVLKLAMKGARGAGQVAERVAAAAPGRVGERAAERVGLRRTQELLRRELPQGLDDVNRYTPHPHLTAEGYRPTAAVATQMPELAGLERASRTTNPEHWMQADELAHRARWNTLDEGLQTADDLAAHLADANDVGSGVDAVFKSIDRAGKQRFNAEMDNFYQRLQQAKQSAEYHGNPAVKSAVDYLEGTMRTAGVTTPKLLHQMKRTLAAGLTGVPGAGDTGVRAAAREPFIVGMTKEMDSILNKASRGKYDQWKADYSSVMSKAEGAKADINIRGKFIDEATGMPKKPLAGLDDVPVLRGHALRQAVASAGSHKRGVRKGQNLLSTGSQDVIEGVARDLDAADVIARSKAASTGGSGSDTAGNLALQSMLMEAMLPTGLGAARYIKAEGNRKAQAQMQRQLATLLQDPEMLRRFLRMAEQQRLLRGQTPRLPGGTAGAVPLMLGGPRE